MTLSLLASATPAELPQRRRTARTPVLGVVPQHLADDALLALSAVERIVGRSRTSIYKGIAAGTFPRPVKLGPKSTAWRCGDLRAWLAARIAERDYTSETVAA